MMVAKTEGQSMKGAIRAACAELQLKNPGGYTGTYLVEANVLCKMQEIVADTRAAAMCFPAGMVIGRSGGASALARKFAARVCSNPEFVETLRKYMM